MAPMNNLQLSEEQTMIRETVRKLVQDTVNPQALEHDEHRRFVRQNFEALAELGVLGLPIAEESGGAGMGMLSFAVALEELGRACGSTARLVLSQTGQCATALAATGRAELAKLVAGEGVGAYVGRECAIVAQPHGDGFILDGFAPMVTAAAEADLLVVVAELAGEGSGLFCLEASTADCQPVAALGFRAAAPGSVRFQGTVCPTGALAARGEDCVAALARVDLASWIGGGAVAVGSGLEVCELSRKHARERKAFGKPLAAKQAVRHKIAECDRMIGAAQHLVYHAARLVEAGEDVVPSQNALKSAIQARLAAVQAAILSADEGIQIHGGFGYTVEYHVERHYRDAMTMQFLDGGEEALLDQLE
jgi:butyryl-CoA dehydrogenase